MDTAKEGERVLWPARNGLSLDYISDPPGEDYRARRPRSLVVLGSTGVIGRAALQIVEANPEFFRIEALCGGRNAGLLAAQAARHRPGILAVQDAGTRDRLIPLLPRGYKPEILTGQTGYASAAALEKAGCVLCAQSGAAGLAGALAAARAGKVIALANKESLVLGGDLIRDVCRETGASVLPVDSEHFALFQCVAGRGDRLKKLTLTASGGPFRGMSREETRSKSLAQALRHPNWSMGVKITVDSATLMNKGLEFMEAMSLYGVGAERVEIVVHPQSIIHSLAVFEDNSLLAQMAAPDMRLPIAACLLWPETAPDCVPPLNLAELGSLGFEQPDLEAFPCLRLALEAAAYDPGEQWRERRINPARVCLNAANEIASELFVAGKINFGAIPELISAAMARLLPRSPSGPGAGEPPEDPFEAIMELDREAREATRELAADFMTNSSRATTNI